ncbi:MAG: hypothetical protein JNM00_15165 [Flavobacteriales bacterium]|nr:hypothetical protein [Flavobacteriales bacterium]
MMRRSLYTLFAGLCLTLLPGAAGAQTIVTGEYFFDVDPGMGLATHFDVMAQGDTVEAEVEINSSFLSPGRHILYVRWKDDSGRWGITNKREVYIVRQNVAAEYFWDTDPGNGNGIPLLTYDDGGVLSICDKVSTTGLAAGLHSLYVRYRSADGVWGIPSQQDVVVEANETPIGCAGDFDNNGTINTSDLLVFLGGFGDAFNCQLDLTDDFVVNTSDLLLFLGGFGGTCP